MIAYLLIMLGLVMRVMPHAPNFTPVVAIALFAGVYLNKKVVPWVPLAIMAVSDLIIGMHDVVLFTWGAFLLIGFLGMWLSKHKSPSSVLISGIMSAVIFFIISNFGVWLVWYPLSIEGFVTCYVKAIPFMRDTLTSTLVYSAVLFGLYEAARKFVGKTRYSSVLLAN
ncbi:MAG: hypothetical protein HQL30_00365 [Candidatus Omnitrophica bacterium]|nr:hypothetical protein [Candidatus Omnitrophota bacterium]